MYSVAKLIVTICVALPFTPYAQTYKVVKIKDGDTIVVLDSANNQVTVRLAAIDCPEKKQDFGQVAKQYTSDKIFGKQVRLSGAKKDRYGRVLAVVIHKQDTLNYDLLRSGYAWHYAQYDKSKYLQSLEDGARKKKVGLWSLPGAVAPWEFRKKRK